MVRFQRKKFKYQRQFSFSRSLSLGVKGPLGVVNFFLCDDTTNIHRTELAILLIKDAFASVADPVVVVVVVFVFVIAMGSQSCDHNI